MKILILGFSKMKFMPYSLFYLDAIDYSCNQVDVVYWNRDLQPEDMSKYHPSVRFHEFRMQMDDSIEKWKKLKYFLAYRRFVLNLLRERHFDRVLTLHTFPGLLVQDKLLKSYKKRYIFDYRDYTFEGILLFGRLIKTFARNACAVFVSSDAYRRFLPSEGVEIITSHNMLRDSFSHRDDRRTKYVPSRKIRIAFWGLVRDYEHNRLVIDRLANDARFELHYYGRSLATGEQIREYIAQHAIDNVFLHGEYKPEDRYEFINNSDILLNSYDDTNMRLAMGNKYYDGVIFRIPQICMRGSYMARRCEERGVGLAADPNDPDYAEQIYTYYKGLDRKVFDAACDVEFDAVKREYESGSRRIKELLYSPLL